MCPQHSQEHYARLTAERRKTKQRKDERARAQALAGLAKYSLEEESMDESTEQVEQGPESPSIYAGLVPEVRLEIAAHYANHAIPGEAITRTYGIGHYTLMKIIDEFDIPKRGRGGPGLTGKKPRGHFEEQGGAKVWITDDPVPNGRAPEPEAVPPPVEQALERMLRLPAKPEPVATVVDRARREAQPIHIPPMLTFEVVVHGRFTVQALDIMAAMQGLIRKYPDLRVTGIREVDPATQV